MSEPSVASNTPGTAARSHLFTVRVWLEELGAGRSEWRGKVQHVLSGEARYFRDWPMLIVRMQEMLGGDSEEAR